MRTKLSTSEHIKFLPVLDRPGFIVEGGSHIIAAHPKVGKTELITRVLAEWQTKKILYVTEESQSMWKARFYYLPDQYEYDHVNLNFIFALGKTAHEITEMIKARDDEVVIIDTLLSVLDERDMSPIISVCREHKRTLIFLHGEAMAFAGAFLGMVDVALEIRRVKNNPNHRTVRGWSSINV